MIILQALLASLLVACVSFVGALLFGNARLLERLERYIAPVAVGVFLSLVLFEILPETLSAAPTYGGIAVALGFIGFYVLANILHTRYHSVGGREACSKKGTGMLVLIGDAIHNVADGVILGGAFLVDPTIGMLTAVGLALHEVPQEIVEFGVLMRAGYSRMQAVLYNFLSASSIFIGTMLVLVLAAYGEGYMWILTGIAAGNLLYLAASDLLPRIHGELPEYGSVWRSAWWITLGFAVMTVTLVWTHAQFGHGHSHDNEHEHEHEREHAELHKEHQSDEHDAYEESQEKHDMHHDDDHDAHDDHHHEE